MSRTSSINNAFYIADPYGGMSTPTRGDDDHSSSRDGYESNIPAPYVYSPPSRNNSRRRCYESNAWNATEAINEQKSDPSIEVSPGQHVRFRGLKETFRAIQQDSFMPVSCLCCSTETLFCIDDASYVLCSICRTISPTNHGELLDGGVGIGFTFEDLGEWQ